jgi:hypothetical protein
MRMLVLATICTLFGLSRVPAADESTELFNGKDLTGWKVAYQDANKKGDPAASFSVKDSALIISGKPNCNIYTEKSYKNYVLTFDWRYPEGSKPDSNSGCLFHMQDGSKFATKCIESQGQYKTHGKIYFMNGQKGESKFDEPALKKVLKPMGEWSSTEVTCEADGAFRVKVNGTPISSGKSELTSGQIGFQCEGWEIHLRNVKIVEKK